MFSLQALAHFRLAGKVVECLAQGCLATKTQPFQLQWGLL